MIDISVATEGDIPAIIASAEALVAADAAAHDPEATDVGWAARTGSAYAEAAVHGDDNVVLLAREDGELAGHLVGRLSGPGSVHPIRVADLESIHVYPRHRGRGIGSRLVDAFFAWALARGADRASVTAYAANEDALQFYARHGFTTRSVILDRDVRAASD